MGAGRPTLTVSLPTYGPSLDGDWRRLLDLARQAEDAGVDRVTVADHVVMGPNTHEYAWGTFPLPPDAPWLEPLTVITAMVGVTARLRFATGILIAPLRPAALLAKTIATLDQLAGGRIDLGVGTGWQREEYEAEGLDFERRGQLLTDTVAACRALWERTPATFTSETVSFEEISCVPKPHQARLPVWFSGVLFGRNVRRVVELGDGWIPIMGATLDDVRVGAELLRTELDANGRAGDALGVQAGPQLATNSDGSRDIPGTMASVPGLVDAGATDIHVMLRVFDPGLEDPAGTLVRLVDELGAATGRG